MFTSTEYSGHRQIRRIDRFLWSGVVIVVVVVVAVAIVITIIVAASPRTCIGVGITLKVMGTGPDIDVIFRWIAGSGRGTVR